MFGFFFGTACLVGLAAMAARGHHHRHHGGGGYGRGPFGGFRRRGLYRLFERLDTTPGQEKAIRSALDELHERVRDTFEELRDARKDVAEAFREERFDEERVSTLLEGPEARFRELREELAKTISKIHDALDPEQRARLARLVESGPRFAYGRC
jgi:Spy/CpxP family protein refolding chaperone